MQTGSTENSLREALATAEREHQRIGKWIVQLRLMLGESFASTNGSRGTAPNQNALPGPYSEMSGPAAAEAVLREAGKALHIKEIVKRMVAGGYQTADQAKYRQSLYANLARQPKRFKKVKTKKATFDLVKQEADTSV